MSSPPQPSAGATGTCLCRLITVTVNVLDFLTTQKGHLCYCSNCRQMTGSIAFSGIALTEAQVHIADPNKHLKTYIDHATDSGSPVERSFCGNCSSPIVIRTPANAAIRTIPLGLFSTTPRPAFESFRHQKPDWQSEIQGTAGWETMPQERKRATLGVMNTANADRFLWFPV